MPISQHIKSLVSLALVDRVLTFRERSAIVEAALKEGVDEQEINGFVNNALAERLKQYTKEELKSCPHCGAQIPLVENQCPFCGGELQNVETRKVPPPFVAGAEADIIRAENLRTAVERRNLRTCPDCGAPFPLVSNVCEQCGHILHEQQGSVLNVNSLINNIRNSISELESTPQPSFFQVLWYRRSIWLFVISLIVFFMAIYLLCFNIFDLLVGSLLAGSFVCLMLAVMSVVKVNLDSPVQIADDRFYKALHHKEMYENHIATLYGKNREAQKLLDEFSTLTKSVKRRRGVMQITFWTLLILAAGGWLVGFGLSKASDTVALATIPDASNYYSVWEEKYPLTLLKNDASKYIAFEGDAVLSLDLSVPPEYVVNQSDTILKARLRVSGLKLSVVHPLYYCNQTVAISLYDRDKQSVAKDFDKLTIAWDNSKYGRFFYKLMTSTPLYGEHFEGHYYAEFLSKKTVEISDKGLSLDSLRQMLGSAVYYCMYITIN